MSDVRGMIQSEYARHRKAKGLKGANPQSVGQAIKKGRIHYNEFGLIDPEVADREWEQNTSTDKYSFARKEQLREKSRQRVLESQEACDDSDIPDIATSDARIKAMKAIKEELDIQQLQGELVRASDIKKDLIEVVLSLKQNLMNIPVRIAPALAPLTDITDIEVAIEQELVSVLNAMSEQFERNRNFK